MRQMSCLFALIITLAAPSTYALNRSEYTPTVFPEEQLSHYRGLGSAGHTAFALGFHRSSQSVDASQVSFSYIRSKKRTMGMFGEFGLGYPAWMFSSDVETKELKAVEGYTFIKKNNTVLTLVLGPTYGISSWMHFYAGGGMVFRLPVSKYGGDGKYYYHYDKGGKVSGTLRAGMGLGIGKLFLDIGAGTQPKSISVGLGYNRQRK